MRTTTAIARRLAASGGLPLAYRRLVLDVVQELGVAEIEVERALAQLVRRGRLRLMGGDWPDLLTVSVRRRPLRGPVAASVAGVAALACSTAPTLPSHKDVEAAITFCQRTAAGRVIWKSCAPNEVAAPTPKTPVQLLAPMPRKEAGATFSSAPATHEPAAARPTTSVPAISPAALGSRPLSSVFWSRSVYFASGADRSAELNSAVAAAASRFASLPEARIVIVGLTDTAGSPLANAALAHRRAEAVRQRLIAAGVPPGAISTYADTSASRPPPAAQPDQPKAASALYRRADIVVRWRPAATV